MNNMQRTNAIAVAAVLSECEGFNLTVRVWLSLSFLLCEHKIANEDPDVYIIAL